MRALTRTSSIIAIAAIALSAGCATTTGTTTGTSSDTTLAETYFVREGMVNSVNPPMEAIWNLQVEVMDDYGNFDPELMGADHWGALETAGNDMVGAAQAMAEAGDYASHDPAGSLGDAPEGTDLAAIQARLTATPDAYRGFSMSFAGHASQLSDAIAARDTAELTRLVNDMQPVCKACHDVYWYPEEYQ